MWALGVASTLFTATTILFIKWILNSLRNLKDEIKELEKRTEDKVYASNKEVLEAIEKLSKSTITTTHCESKQELWGERFDNWIKMVGVKSETDEQSHDRIINTMQGMADQIEALSKCITDMQKGRDCK